MCDGPLTDELNEVVSEMEAAHSGTLHVVRLDKNGGLGNQYVMGFLIDQTLNKADEEGQMSIYEKTKVSTRAVITRVDTFIGADCSLQWHEETPVRWTGVSSCGCGGRIWSALRCPENAAGLR